MCQQKSKLVADPGGGTTGGGTTGVHTSKVRHAQSNESQTTERYADDELDDGFPVIWQMGQLKWIC